MTYNYIVVGSGLTGATIARKLKDIGESVLVIEKRNHLGGNVHDQLHFSSIRYDTYGPHYFRTSDLEIWNFVNRFSKFYNFEACIKSYVDNEYVNWPLGYTYIKKVIGENWEPYFRGKPNNFEESALSLMPYEIYNKFIKNYNKKQWGIDPKLLSSELIKRFDVRLDDDPRLMPNHKFQGIPKDGYSSMMTNMLKDIPVLLNFDFLSNREKIKPNKMLIYTGPIDSFFNYKFGKLEYRGQKRYHEFIPDIDFLLPSCQVNNPSIEYGDHIRTIEWKHIMPKEKSENIKGTLITKEVSFSPINSDDFEYPFPDKINKDLYNKYKHLASNQEKLLICGRLGEYKYYDMDQAIGRAFMLFNKIIND